MEKVNIIIPIYNSEEYLTKCLDSIKNQTLKEIKAILVNDGSTDSSEKIIDEYIEKYPQIFIKINKQNGGQGSARNLGLEKVTGEYVVFIDSDDYLQENMLEKLYDVAKKNDSDLVICDYYEIENENKIAKKAIESIDNEIKVNYMLSNASPWNKLIKTTIFKENKINFLEGHIYEDLATMPVLTDYLKNIVYLEEPLYNYIIRAGSTMRQNTYNKKLESIFVAIEHLEQEFRKRNILKKYQEEMEFLNIYHLLYAASGRFLKYKEGKKQLKKIREIIKNNYPNWKKNKYYKIQSLQIKVTVNIFYYNICVNGYSLLRKIIKRHS